MLTDPIELQSFLGWCLVINMIIYIVWVVAIYSAQNWVVTLHGRLFGVEPQAVRTMLYAALIIYKLLLTLFSFVPWLALVIMNS